MKNNIFKKPKRKVSKVFLHCSASDYENHDDISMIRGWHLKRGFKDVGYHFFIKRNGIIQKGRDLEKIPSAQKGHNRRSIAICVSGLENFSKESLKSLKNFCKEINKIYDSNITFHGHCEVSNKTCPVFDYKTLLNLNKEGKMGVKIDNFIKGCMKKTPEDKKRNKLIAISLLAFTGLIGVFKLLFKANRFCYYVLPNHPKIRMILNTIIWLFMAFIGYRAVIFILPYFN